MHACCCTLCLACWAGLRYMNITAVATVTAFFHHLAFAIHHLTNLTFLSHDARTIRRQRLPCLA